MRVLLGSENMKTPISEDIKLIKDLERNLKSIKEYCDINSDEQSIFYQEMKKQYIDLATLLCKKREDLSIKIKQMQ
jgi:DNA-binding transcriptional MerR regulator